jgi:peptidoglycan hydrolase CwlO-like protein
MIKINNYKKLFIITGAIFVLCLVNFRIIFADDTDCSVLEGDAKDKCENLEKKAEVYQDLIDLKNKQQDTLQNQLQAIDRDQAKNKSELQKTQADVENFAAQIDSLERDIAEKEKYMNTQKVILSGLVQSYYEYDQQGMLDVVLTDKSFSDLVNQSDYIEQSGMRVNEVLAEIISTRDELKKSQSLLMTKKDDLEKAQQNLIDKNYNLQSSEQQKQSLMDKTQGEEEKYKQLLAHVEEQQKELFDFSSASNASEVSASVSSYAKPSSKLASTSWYFSQKDSRWGNQKIGNSNTYMKSYGCAVTCVSMVFRKLGASIDPGKMAKEKIFYYDLIKWPSSWSPGISLASSITHGNIKWSTIDLQIAKGNPVIVYIKKTNGGGGHYVVVTGKDSKDYIVHDPYFGANLYLGTSKALVGKIGKDSGVALDQMIIYE